MAQPGSASQLVLSKPVPAPPAKQQLFQVKVIHTDEAYDGDIYGKGAKSDSTAWTAQTTKLMSSKEWLKSHSLKANHLDSRTVYPQLGFLHLEEFNPILKKPVTSRYGEHLFVKHLRDDGKRMNVVAQHDLLRKFKNRLENAVSLFQQRLDWLSTSSRHMCGVILERSVTLLLDLRTNSERDFDQCLCVVERLLKEQMSRIDRFNLIACVDNAPAFQNETVPATKGNIELCVDWLWALPQGVPTSEASLMAAFLKASTDKSNEAIYYFTEGDATSFTRAILDQYNHRQLPLNIILYNYSNKEWASYLKSASVIHHGRFHAYSTSLKVNSYEGMPVNEETLRADIAVRTRVYGGVSADSTLREDCLLVFQELESARQMVSQIKNLLQQMSLTDKLTTESDVAPDKREDDTRPLVREEDMTSQEWLKVFGLKARKLDFYDVLKNCVFKHCDGVVTIQHPPYDEIDGFDFNEQHDAVREPKLVNAKYCDKFAHVRWKDDSIVHVHVTSDVYRLYEKRMQVAISALKRRIDMLKKGSRELFGTISENQVYILLDTSGSMEPSMTMVKDKLYILLQEQLRQKKLINFVAFNSKAYPWREHLVEVSETNIRNAWQWLRTQRCSGSTNTMAALKFALSDPHTEGVYLLTDGRPDQPPKTVLAHCQMFRKVPVHTISFNCADQEANEFLLQLAQDTGGRFHVFHDQVVVKKPTKPGEEEVTSWESEDIRLLKDEYHMALASLEQVGKLRDECFRLAWKKETHQIDVNASSSYLTKRHKPCLVPRPKIDNYDIADRCGKPYYEEDSADRRSAKTPRRAVSSTRPKSRKTLQKSLQNRSPQPLSKDPYLKTMLPRKTHSQEWLMPETKEILDSQDKRYKVALRDEENARRFPEDRNTSNNPAKRHRDISVSEWLKQNTLKKKHLTIYDALGPCTIHPTPRHSSEQRKRRIKPELFEEALPPHTLKVSPRQSTQKLSSRRRHDSSSVDEEEEDLEQLELRHVVVTPLSGAEWKSYRENLEKMLVLYDDKWVDALRECLTRAQISEMIDGPAHSLNFLEHHEKVKEMLQRLKIVIKEPAFPTLTKELRKGWGYYRQSLMLDNADISEPSDPEVRNNSNAKPTSENNNNHDRKEDEEQNSRPPPTPEDTAIHREVRTSPKASPKSPATTDTHTDVGASPRSNRPPSGSSRGTNSEKPPHSSTGTSDPPPRSPTSNRDSSSNSKMSSSEHHRGNRHHNKNNNNNATRGRKNSVSSTNNSSSRSSSWNLDKSSLNGQAVLAPSDQTGYYHDCVIVECLRDGLVEVEDAETGRVFKAPTNQCILVRKPGKRTVKHVDDHVLVKTFNVDIGQVCHIPAQVTRAPSSPSSTTRPFYIRLFTGREHKAKRDELVKITPSVYAAAIKCILTKNPQNPPSSRTSEHEKADYEHNRDWKRHAHSSQNRSRERHYSSDSDSKRTISDHRAQRRTSSATSHSDRYRRHRSHDDHHEPRSVEENLHRQARQINSLNSLIRNEVRSLRRSQHQLAAALPTAEERQRQQKELQQVREDVARLDGLVKELVSEKKPEHSSRRSSSQAASATATSSLLETSSEKGEELVPSQEVEKHRQTPEVGRTVVTEVENSLQFCEGSVVEKLPDNFFTIRDPSGHTFRSHVSAIYAETLSSSTEKLDGTTILAPLGPDFYSPAVVLGTGTGSNDVKVRFCDGQERVCKREKCYILQLEEFEGLVRRMKARESQLWGSAVVTRDDRSGFFVKGTLLSRDEASGGARFNILLATGEVVRQRSMHVFRHGLILKVPQDGEKVLAKYSKNASFLPAWVLHYEEETLRCKVHFFHGEEEVVSLREIIPVSNEYYKICLQNLREQVV